MHSTTPVFASAFTPTVTEMLTWTVLDSDDDDSDDDHDSDADDDEDDDIMIVIATMMMR